MHECTYYQRGMHVQQSTCSQYAVNMRLLTVLWVSHDSLSFSCCRSSTLAHKLSIIQNIKHAQYRV